MEVIPSATVSPNRDASSHCRTPLNSISSPNPAAKPSATEVINARPGLKVPPKSAKTLRCVAIVTSCKAGLLFSKKSRRNASVKIGMVKRSPCWIALLSKEIPGPNPLLGVLKMLAARAAARMRRDCPPTKARVVLPSKSSSTGGSSFCGDDDKRGAVVCDVFP